MIKLNHNQWHVCVFLWCLTTRDNFFVTHSDARVSGQTNLCHYFRVIFVTTPIILILQATLLSWVSYVLVIWPITSFGVWAWLYTAAIVLVGAIISLVTVAILAYVAHRRVKPKPEKSPGVVALLGKFLVAQKRKICPLIEIERGQS